MSSNLVTSIYGHKFTNLKEYMVPLKVLLMMVQQVENYPGYDAAVYDEDKNDISDDVYCVPYPYRNPIDPKLASYMENHGVEATVNDFSKDTLETWYKMIQERVEPIILNGLRSSTINNFDKDDNSAIILSTLSGKPIQFEYKNLLGLETYGIPYELPRILHEGISIVKSMNEAADEYEIYNATACYQRLKELTRDLTINSGYMGFYKFMYRMKDNKIKVIWLKGSPGPTILNLDGFQISSTYIQESALAHKKVIFTI